MFVADYAVAREAIGVGGGDVRWGGAGVAELARSYRAGLRGCVVGCGLWGAGGRKQGGKEGKEGKQEGKKGKTGLEGVSTVTAYERQRSVKKREMIAASKKRKLAGAA
eukprot:5195396-Pyramimonas_sp.AAC.1